MVGIGVSSRDPEALARLLTALPHAEVAYLVTTSTSAPSLLPTVERALSSASIDLPIYDAHDGVELQPNAIYVSAHGGSLSVHETRLRMSPLPATGRLDAFFSSLGHTLGSHACGILLADRTCEGMQGLRSLTRQGGLSLAVESEQTSYLRQPWRVGTGLTMIPSHVPARVRSEIQRWRERVSALGGSVRWDLDSHLERACGIDISMYKTAALRARLATRMALRHVDDVDGYLALLESSPDERAALRDAVLVGSTSFFRDAATFELIRDTLLPHVVNANDTEPMRIWVPGCSTGQEAYSLAMIVCEYLEATGSRRDLRVYATDARGSAVEHGRRGIYPAGCAEQLSEQRLARFFVACDGGYQVARRLREKVIWGVHDVVRDPPFPRLDLVSCRNVLVYFERRAQQRALSLLAYALRPGGGLVLGGAESTLAARGLFDTFDHENRLYLKRAVARPSSVFAEPARGC